MNGILVNIRENARAQPTATAISDGAQSWSYERLYETVRHNEERMLSAGVAPGHVLALDTPRSPELIAHIIAGLNLNCAVQFSNATELAADWHMTLAGLTQGKSNAGRGPTEGHDLGVAYIMPTTGSSGQPKAVAVTRKGLAAQLEGKVHALGLRATDKVAQTAIQTSSVYLWQALAPLSVGARVDVISPAKIMDSRTYFENLLSERISVTQVAPAQLSTLLAAAAAGGYSPARDVRVLSVTGDSFPRRLAVDAASFFPNALIVNAYGSTETSDDTHHYSFPAKDVHDLPRLPFVPIGLPNVSTQEILLEMSAPSNPSQGDLAELTIGGNQVSLGYLNDAALTADKFRPNTADASGGTRLYSTGDLVRRLDTGDLYCVGRFDLVVKVNGERLPLEALEDLVCAQDDIGDCAVVAAADGTNSATYLGIFYTPGNSSPRSQDRLTELARGYLQSHQGVRLLVQEVDDLPMNRTGKTDRLLLRSRMMERVDTSRQATQPADDITSSRSQVVATSWAALLGERPADQDNFFESGGHSLAVLELLSQVNETFGASIQLYEFLEDPTFARLVDLVERSAVKHG